MSTVSLRLLESLHRKLAELGKRARAKRSRKRFTKALAKVADIEPEDVDRLMTK